MAEAYIFPNGNVMYFDFEGEQIPEFQKRKLEALKEFKEEYPKSNIFFAEWEKGEIITDIPLKEGILEQLYKIGD